MLLHDVKFGELDYITLIGSNVNWRKAIAYIADMLIYSYNRVMRSLGWTCLQLPIKDYRRYAVIAWSYRSLYTWEKYTGNVISGSVYVCIIS